MFNNGFVQQNNSGAQNEELAQKIRKDIIGELEAIIQYEEHAMSTNNAKMQKIWKDIASEEKIHIGELMEALFYFDPDSKMQYDKGVQEFEQLTRRW